MTEVSAGSGLALSEALSEYGERIAHDTLRFQRHFSVSVERVWQAIVTPESIAAWLGRATAIEAHTGGAFEVWLSDEDRMDGRVVEIEPNRRLAIAWRENGHVESSVTFELSATAGGGTDLVLTHRYISTAEHTIGLARGGIRISTLWPHT